MDFYTLFGLSQWPSPLTNAGDSQETRAQSLGWEDPLEQEMATHSNILAWKIPWMEEPGYSPWVCKESDTTERTHTLIPHHTLIPTYLLGFPHVSVVKNLPADARDMGSIPGSRKPPWRRKWQLTPVSCLGNLRYRGACRFTVHGVTKESDVTQQLKTTLSLQSQQC